MCLAVCDLLFWKISLCTLLLCILFELIIDITHSFDGRLWTPSTCLILPQRRHARPRNRRWIGLRMYFMPLAACMKSRSPYIESRCPLRGLVRTFLRVTLGQARRCTVLSMVNRSTCIQEPFSMGPHSNTNTCLHSFHILVPASSPSKWNARSTATT